MSKNAPWLILCLVLAIVGYGLGRYTRAQNLREYIYVTDTLRQEVVRLDTVFASRLRVLDSTRTVWDTVRVRDTLVRNDTVFVPRDIADATLLACTETLTTCEQQKAALRSLWFTADSTVRKWGGPPSRVDWKLSSALSALLAMVLTLIFR